MSGDEPGKAKGTPPHPEDERVYNQPAPKLEQVPHDDIAHSPQAMKVLLEDGGDAYKAYVERQRKIRKATPKD